MLGTSTSTKQGASENFLLIELSRTSLLLFEETPEISSVAPDTVEGCKKDKKKKKKKKKKTKALSERRPEEPAIDHNQKEVHQLTVVKRGKEPKHKEQTVTVVEKERKKRKKGKEENQLNVVQNEMEVPDPEEQTGGKTKKKSKNLQTQQVGEDGVTADEENMSSRKKKRKHNKVETEGGIDRVLSKPAVDVSAVTAPDEARKSKKKHKNRQTDLEEGAESRQTVSRTADDAEIIELHTETVKRGKDVVTEVEENVKEKRKRKKKKKHRESQLNDCPDKADLPGIKEQTERKLKSKRPKTDGGSAAVQGSGRKRKHNRESDKGMDSVHSQSAVDVLDLTVPNDNRTHDAGTNGETEEGAHPTMVDTGTQHNRPSLKEETLSEDDWQALNDLKEFIPNIERKSVDEIHKMIKYDLDRFKEFRRQGLSLRSGRYNAQENKRLVSNVYDFLALTGIQSASKLFHPQRFNKEEANIKKLKRQHRFHERIAEGIPRPWHQVYIRGRKMFDCSNYKGRFTKKELHSLKKLQTLHGNKWAKISQLTGRSETALEKRFSQMSANRGAWTEEELKRLMEAVRKHLVGQALPGSGPATIRKDKLYNNIPWTDVCRTVETRHWSQCRGKWLGVLKHKMANGQPVFSGGTKSLQGKVDLIKALNAMQVEDAADINWEEIAHTIGDVTPRYVQTHYYRLKVAKVPLWERMSFCEIIDFLNSRVLPNFEEQLNVLIKSGEVVPRNDPQELFLLSEIFDNEEDSDDYSEVQNS